MADLTLSATMTGGEAFMHADAAGLVRRIGQELAMRAAQAVIDTSRPNVPVDRGLLKSSGSATPTDDGAIAQYDVPYAADVEHGTDAHDVPVAELQGWAARHDIPAWLVHEAIAKNGTRAQPYFGPAVEVMKGEMPGMAAQAAADLRAALLGGH